MTRESIGFKIIMTAILTLIRGEVRTLSSAHLDEIMVIFGAVILVAGLILFHNEHSRRWKIPVWATSLLIGFCLLFLPMFLWHPPTTVAYRGGSLPAGQYQIVPPEGGKMLLYSSEKVPPKDVEGIFVYYIERGQDVDIIWVENGDPKAFTFEVRRRSPTAEWAGLEMKAYLPGYMPVHPEKQRLP